MKSVGKTKKSSSSKDREKARQPVRELLRLGQLLSEKCELARAGETYREARRLAEKAGDLRAEIEAISGLLMLAGEALDGEAMRKLDRELDQLMAASPRRVPPMVWYCKGAIATNREDYPLAQRHFHRFLRASRQESATAWASGLMTRDEAIARGWLMLAITSMRRGHRRRALWLGEQLLARFGDGKIRVVRGFAQLLLGRLAERDRDLATALAWFQKAHASFLAEHHWYYHLHVLYGYARIARAQQNYPQSYFYLDLMDKAASGPEFGLIRQEIAAERARLEQDAVDLLIDSRRGVVKTREGGAISLRKQYVLLNILEALSSAHGPGGDGERGLSKAEIIEKVWRERYRPEAHDNKLYYNINRLRKLIEPDVRQPQYLLNWKEGYRLAPGLRVQRVSSPSSSAKTEGGK